MTHWQQTVKRRTEPPRPSMAVGREQVKRLRALKQKRDDLEADRECQQEVLKTLGPRRSLTHWFGSPAEKVDEAEAELEKTEQTLNQTKTEQRQVWTEWKAGQAKAEKHAAWAKHYAGMLALERVLALSAVQQRLGIAHREAARRAQQERELAGQERWYQVARFLEKSRGYLDRIREVTAEVEAGEPLSEAATTARQQDLDEYNDRLLKQPGTLKEVNRIVEAMSEQVEREGMWRKGRRVFEDEQWRLEVAGNSFRATSQADGCVVLEVKDHELERYQPLAREREDLRQYCQHVEQQQQQRSRGRGLSR